MQKIIYKKSDRKIVAYVLDRATAEQEDKALQVKLDAICVNPKLGGTAEDYGIIEMENCKQDEKILTVNSELQPEFIDNPKIVKTEQDKQSGRQKLIDLGLTDDEITAMTGG
jgi:hypothetical protein